MSMAPDPEPSSSVLEELWNKGVLKPESYPDLIRALQRELNRLRELTREMGKAMAEARDIFQEMRERDSDSRSMTED